MILVIGCPRSGTSIVTNMLKELLHLETKIYKENNLDNLLTRQLNPTGFHQRLDIHNLCFETYVDAGIPYHGPWLKLPQSENTQYKKSMQKFRQHFRNIIETDKIELLKDPYLLLLVEFNPEIWDLITHVIVVYRNFDNTLASQERWNKVYNSQSLPDDYWITYYLQILKFHKKFHKTGKSFVTVKYEDIVRNDQEEVVEKLLKYLAIPCPQPSKKAINKWCTSIRTSHIITDTRHPNPKLYNAILKKLDFLKIPQ